MSKSLFRSIAAAAVLLSCGMTTTAAKAEVWREVNGNQVRIANSLTVFEMSDDRLLERLRRELMAQVETTDALPYPTLESIPDARTLGYGDCKSISVAMRNMLVAEGFSPDSLLLATAVTEKGDPHMVLLIRGKYRGFEQTRVFDIRVREITTIERLIDHGYKFEAIESAPGPGAMLLRFDGKNYL